MNASFVCVAARIRTLLSHALTGEYQYPHRTVRLRLATGYRFRIVRSMVSFGSVLCVPGNHDMKLMKKFNGRDVQITHGLAQSLAEIDAMPDDV